MSVLLENSPVIGETVRPFGFNTNKNITVGGSANFDMSSSTGTFKFPSGIVSGQTYNVISGQGATRTLLASETDSVCLFDRAAGIVYTLPAAAAGLQFYFFTTVTITSNAAEVAVANEGTTFMTGAVTLAPNSATPGGSAIFAGDGSSHVEITSNGTTTGGIIGSTYALTCVSSTLWVVSQGLLIGSGTLATPFST